jgi:hypothetical protein
MAKRNLRIIKRVRNVPVLGICEYCNSQFTADQHGQSAAAQAALQQQFNAHKCQSLDTGQSAALAAKEVTK